MMISEIQCLKTMLKTIVFLSDFRKKQDLLKSLLLLHDVVEKIALISAQRS